MAIPGVKTAKLGFAGIIFKQKKLRSLHWLPATKSDVSDLMNSL